MSRVILLDTGPLGLLTNPLKPPRTVAALTWAIEMMSAKHRFIVPAIADYEVRRELRRAGKSAGLIELNTWNQANPGRYLPLSDSALLLASELWAQARNGGTPTADPKELDCDVLIAAQALDMGVSDFIVATTNPAHLALFVPVALWEDITP